MQKSRHWTEKNKKKNFFLVWKDFFSLEEELKGEDIIYKTNQVTWHRQGNLSNELYQAVFLFSSDLPLHLSQA